MSSSGCSCRPSPPAARDRILTIKEAAHQRREPVQGIKAYQAVLDGGVADYAGFLTANARNPGGLSPWSPRLPDGRD